MFCVTPILQAVRSSGRARGEFEKRIFRLYAEFIRLSRRYPGLLDKVREEFRRDSHLDYQQNSNQIDNKYRRGQQQLKLLKTTNVSAVRTFTVKKE
jgi:hypothetical protein